MAGYHGFSKSNNAIIAEENGEFPATVAAKKLAIIDTLHKDLQRIIDDLLINDDELWIIANRETRSRLLILVDMADYVYDLVKKKSEKGE